MDALAVQRLHQGGILAFWVADEHVTRVAQTTWDLFPLGREGLARAGRP